LLRGLIIVERYRDLLRSFIPARETFFLLGLRVAEGRFH
jgi:hypothetical protein